MCKSRCNRNIVIETERFIKTFVKSQDPLSYNTMNEALGCSMNKTT
jgi:hypothetical protein